MYNQSSVTDCNTSNTNRSSVSPINPNLKPSLNSETTDRISQSKIQTSALTNSIQRFRPISSSALICHLNQSSDSLDQTLILDIRSSSENHQIRIRNSINLNLPTTLLKRPLHGLERIEASLDSQNDRIRFSTYRTRLPTSSSHTTTSSSSSSSTLSRVVVLDSDSNSSNPGPNHPLILLLRKFEFVGFLGDLLWLVGGFRGFSKTIGSAQYIIRGTIDDAGTTASNCQSARPHGGGTSLRMSLPLPPSMIGPFIPTSSTTSSSPPQSSSSPSSSSPSSSSSRTQSSQNYSPSNPLPSSSSLQQPAQLNIQRFNQNSTTTTLNLPTVTTASRNIPSTLKRHQLVFKLNQIQNLSQSPSLQSDLTTPISELATDLKNRSFNSPHNNTNQQQPRMKKLTEKRRNQTSSSSSSSSSSTAAAMNNNPFFDNIRQLNERLSLDVSLKNLSPIELWELENPKEYLYLLPDFLSDLILKDPIDRARLLAHQFYDLEIAEQRRLQDVMRWHCSQKTHISSSSSSSSNNTSNIVSNDSTALNRTSNKSIFKNFSSSGSSKLRDHQKLDRKPNLDGGVLGGIENHPFSISAGVELGYKNRYRNIWPWEHTRIRLPEKQSKASGTDYINASMITFRDEGGPRMSEEDRKDLRKGYIATQGPLGSTFDDFWSMVKEEDVGVIVMLTRRHEAGREKCGDYVKNGTYGDLVIRIESDRSSLGNSTHLNTGASDATLGNDEDSVDEDRKRLGDFFGFGGSSSVQPNLQRKSSLKTTRKTSLSGNGAAVGSGGGINQRGPNNNGVTKKLVKLSIANRPDLPPREIRHLQYRKWPDFDVPPVMEELLELSEQTQNESRTVVEANLASIKSHHSSGSGSKSREGLDDLIKLIGTGQGPILVHCSAGVGRTGSFIIVDVMKKVLKVKYIKPRMMALTLTEGLGRPDHQNNSEVSEIEEGGSRLESKDESTDGSNQKARDESGGDVEAFRKRSNLNRSCQGRNFQEGRKKLGSDSDKNCVNDDLDDCEKGCSDIDYDDDDDDNNDKDEIGEEEDDKVEKKSAKKKKRKKLQDNLPQFFQSDVYGHGAGDEGVSSMWSRSPVMSLVNEMREQRMSMVANYRQYVFVHEVLMCYLIRELKIKVKK